jgi:hypothetical protein
VSGIVAAFMAVDAEGKQLEDIATPITAAEAEVVGGADEQEQPEGDERQLEPARAAGAPATAAAVSRGRRFGRGTSHGWAPSASYSTTIDEDLRDEVASIETALRQSDAPMRREALKQTVNSRFWGPGCFNKALWQAVDAGIVTRAGRNTFALAGDGRNREGVPFVTGERERSEHR